MTSHSKIWRLPAACAAAIAVVVGGSQAASSFTLLYSFQSFSDGQFPLGDLIRDRAGNMYGTTYEGGDSSTCANYYHCGTVFKITSTGSETVLYRFLGGSSDGEFPSGGLIEDKSGNFYGTTYEGGGTGCSENGCGTVFKMSSTGVEAPLYAFSGGSDGGYPNGDLIAASGNLYGTACQGGADNGGTVFEVSEKTGKETVLYSFTGGKDGSCPAAGVITDTSGNFYGTTSSGGSYGGGTVYKLASGKETTLYSFCKAKNCTDGQSPKGGVIFDAAGNLYGTTYVGGAKALGVVYKLAPDGTQSVLHSFCTKINCADGGQPITKLIVDKSGNLYGTATSGNANGYGVVFKVTSGGKETVLHSFDGSDGGYPVGGLLSVGKNLYGTAEYGGSIGACGGSYGCGTVYVLPK